MNIWRRKRFLISLAGVCLLLLSHGRYAPAEASDISNDLSIHVGIKKSSGMTNASISGNFIMCEYGTDSGIENPQPWTGRLLLNFGGNGNGTFQQLADSNNGTLGSGSFIYAVSSDGKVSVDSGKYYGIVSADGKMFVIVDTNKTDSDLDLSIHVGIKESSGMSKSSLIGTFIMCEYGRDPERWTGRLELTFDGNEGGTFQQLDDSRGYKNSGELTYTVADDGTVTIDGKYSGILSADGNMFVIVDTDKSDTDLSIHVGVKKPSGMSDDDMDAEFIMCEYGTEYAPPEPHRWTGRLDLDFEGDGTGTFQQLNDSSGDTGSDSFTYAVSSDGTISTGGQGIEDKGIVNADANMFVIVDTNVDKRAMPWIPLLLLGD